MVDVFDEMDEAPLNDGSMEPLYKVLEKNKKDETLAWCIKTVDTLREQAVSRTTVQRRNLEAYRGITHSPKDTALNRYRKDGRKRLNKIDKFVVNHLYDLTETKVSQMTRLKPSIEVLPANDEWGDRASAKVVGLLIKHLWTINNIDYMTQKMHRAARIFGESFLFVLWDENKGDLAPQYVEARDAGVTEIEVDGKMFNMKTPIYTGDVDYQLEVPWRVLLQRQLDYNLSEYVIRISTIPTETLKRDYPKHKRSILSSDGLSIYDTGELKDRFLEEHTIVYELYNKFTQFLDKGAYIKFTPDVILEKGDLPFTHGELPCIRLTDMDVPDTLNGVSRYEMILPIQSMYDNMSTLIAKNIYLTAHPKWMMPRGACKIEQLGNEGTIVQFQGAVAPYMAQVAPNSPEVYSFRNDLKQDMQTIYGSHGISRGEVPKGITAASALQFLNELENERGSTDIAKHGFMVKELAKKTIAVCADNYDVNDGRMIRIVGENNKFLIRHFDAANLNKNYDVKYDNSTGLPETKAAKIQRIMDAMQRNPTLFSPERWEDLLELGNTESFVKLSTAAIKSADSENDDLSAGEPVFAPEEYEDHIAHWQSHARLFQSRTFKEEATDDVVKAAIEHQKITEELMLLKAKVSPLFQARLAELKLFPMFYHADMQIPSSAAHQEAMVQGQANRGEEVTGAIPAQDIEDIKEANNG